MEFYPVIINVADGSHGSLDFNVAAFGYSVLHPFDSEQVNLVNPHFDSANREVAMSV